MNWSDHIDLLVKAGVAERWTDKWGVPVVTIADGPSRAAWTLLDGGRVPSWCSCPNEIIEARIVRAGHEREVNGKPDPLCIAPSPQLSRAGWSMVWYIHPHRYSRPAPAFPAYDDALLAMLRLIAEEA